MENPPLVTLSSESMGKKSQQPHTYTSGHTFEPSLDQWWLGAALPLYGDRRAVKPMSRFGRCWWKDSWINEFIWKDRVIPDCSGVWTCFKAHNLTVYVTPTCDSAKANFLAETLHPASEAYLCFQCVVCLLWPFGMTATFVKDSIPNT